MLLVLWAITPLQSALLATGVVVNIEQIHVTGNSGLTQVREQADMMDASIRGTIYHTTWLNLSFPEFTTAEYALNPFQMSEDSRLQGTSTNVTGSTSKYWAEVSCLPAKVSVGEFETSSNGMWSGVVPFYFVDDKGCNATIFPDDIIFRDSDPEVSMRYWGSYTDDNFYDLEPMDGPWRWELASQECPNVRNRFIAAWMKQKYNGQYDPPDINITAIWCDTTYYKQNVEVRLDARTMRPVDTVVRALTPRQPLKEDEFNITAFEQFMKVGQLDQGPVRSREIELFEHESFLFGTSLAKLYEPIPVPVGYALAVDMLDIEKYSNPDVLGKAYESAWKRQFALLAHHLMADSEREPDSTVKIERHMTAVLVNRAFATALEVLLLLVASLTVALLWFCHKAPSNLRMNPSSIARIGKISGDSPEICNILSPMSSWNNEDLKGKLTGKRLRLVPADTGRGTEPIIEIIQDMAGSAGDPAVMKQEAFFQAIRPFALKQRSGWLFALAVIGAVISLSYLKSVDDAHNGLQRPTENFEVLQLLENYIPTIFATLVEPFWVMLNRLLCMLQPFKDLCHGQAKPEKTLDATYTAIPPQLAVWRALISKHFVLAMICSTALLANLLALSMGALFNEEPVKVETQESSAAAFAMRIDTPLADVYRDNGRMVGGGPRKPHVISTQANITDGLGMPAWTTPDYYFRPAKLENLTNAKNYTIMTHGFSLDANCTGFEADKILLDPPARDKNRNRCDNTLEDVDREMRDDLGSAGFDTDATNDAKYTYQSRWSSDITDEKGATLNCDPTIVWGWGRTQDAGNRNASAVASRLVCRPRFQYGPFNVTVDKAGNVLSYNQTGKMSASFDDGKSEGHLRMMITLLHDGDLLGPPGWFNDTSYHGVFDMLLVKLSNSTATVNPTESLPDAKKLVKPIERIYQQLFVSMLSFNPGVFADAEPTDTIETVAHSEETRILMNETAFIITMTILGINLVATVLFYGKTSSLALPRLPTTIGSVIAYIAPSRLVLEGKADNATYSFGRYLGHDGKPHVGIEQDPFVVPIAPGSLEGRRPLLRRLGWRKEHSGGGDGPWM
ncbi:hypothetical protein LIA77_08428 [Sarocladium implicatum]|nr:hypothetical protein LIA77_08428 [Sarocladium implicatum]